MLKIFNELGPFFEDCYREFGVREYARTIKVTPPTASKILSYLESEELLKRREERGYILFRANRESSILKDLSLIYWRIKLRDAIRAIDSELNSPTIVLFGSLSKLESRPDSDIDIAVFSPSKKNMELEPHEKKLHRRIQLFRFKRYSNK